jgi:outer membrane protein TolC
VKNSEAAYFNFEKARLDLINRIAEAYYEYAYLSKSIIITKETINLLRSFENVAQAKYASGTTQNQDLLKVQLELGKMENDLMAMEDMRRPLVASLNALLNLPQDSDLPWPSEDLENIDVDNTYSETEKLAAELKRNNPALLAMDETVGRETANLKLTKRAYFPDLTVGVTQEYMPAGMSGNEQEQRMVMFSINVPIWFNRINAEIEDARASLKAAENGRDNLKNEILSELAMAQYKLRNSVRQARLYKEALIPKAVQTLNATKSAYEAGGMDFLSLIEAQRELLNFQLIYYRQNADYQQRLIQMRSLIGTLRTDNESVRSTK